MDGMSEILERAGLGSNGPNGPNGRDGEGEEKNFLQKKSPSQIPALNRTSSKLSEIEELILFADLSAPAGDAEALQAAREQVAIQLGCEPADLEEIAAGREGGKEAWAVLVMEERVKRAVNSPMQKDATWDRLEGAVLQKLVRLVEGNRVSAVGELLAIAKVANQAHRSNGRRGSGSEGGVNVTQNNFIGNGGKDGVLPSGDLGTIKLSLSRRSAKQIEGTVNRQGGEEKVRVLDQVEMMTIEDVQQAGDSFEES